MHYNNNNEIFACHSRNLINNEEQTAAVIILVFNTSQNGMKRRLCQIPCAFHPDHVITNFCSKDTCLLPLCPKCISIHNVQHSKRNIPSNFEPIQDATRLVAKEISDKARNVSSLGETVQQRIVSLSRGVNAAIEQLHDCVQKILADLNRQLNFVVIAITKELQDDEALLRSKLTTLRDSAEQTLEQLQVVNKEMHSNRLLQVVIGFHTQLKSRWQACEAEVLKGLQDPRILSEYNIRRIEQKFEECKGKLRDCLLISRGRPRAQHSSESKQAMRESVRTS